MQKNIKGIRDTKILLRLHFLFILAIEDSMDFILQDEHNGTQACRPKLRSNHSTLENSIKVVSLVPRRSVRLLGHKIGTDGHLKDSCSPWHLSMPVPLACSLLLVLAFFWDSCACPAGYNASHQDVRLFVIGDWGRGGSASQRLVAKQMDLQARQCYQPLHCVISTGDNMYPHGLRGPDDPFFTQTFTQTYWQSSLQVM